MYKYSLHAHVDTLGKSGLTCKPDASIPTYHLYQVTRWASHEGSPLFAAPLWTMRATLTIMKVPQPCTLITSGTRQQHRAQRHTIGFRDEFWFRDRSGSWGGGRIDAEREIRRLGGQDALIPGLGRFSEAGNGPCENSFNQPVVNQTERRGKDRRLSRRHSLDVLHQRLWILLGKVSVDELDLHIHDRFVTEKMRVNPSMRKKKRAERFSNAPTSRRMN